jgi:hypothetical protein
MMDRFNRFDRSNLILVGELILEKQQKKISITKGIEHAAAKPLSAVEQIIRDRAITELVVTQNLLLSFITSEVFVRYSNVMDPRYAVPTTERVKNLINDSFQRMSAILRHELNEAESVSLTADLWTAHSREGYLGVTASWITSDFHLNEAVLALSQLPYPHTGQAIADRIKRISEFWSIDRKIFTITTDGGSNMKSACSRLGVKQVLCAAHTLNLIVKKGLVPAERLIKRMKRLIKFFTTPKQGERLNSVQASVRQSKGKGRADTVEVVI